MEKLSKNLQAENYGKDQEKLINDLGEFIQKFRTKLDQLEKLTHYKNQQGTPNWLELALELESAFEFGSTFSIYAHYTKYCESENTESKDWPRGTSTWNSI